MDTFTHGRITIALHDVGPSGSTQAPAVVFVHNGGTSSTIWRHQVADLSADHRVIALDLPGFGESPLPSPAVDLQEMVDLVAALIAEKDLAPALMVGNCMGSNIALRLAGQDPGLVRGILVVNPLTAASFSGGHIGFLHTMSRRFAGPTKALRSVARHIRVPRPVAGMTLRFQLGREGVAQGLHKDADLLACQTRSDQLPALIDVLDDMSAYGGVDALGAPPPVPTWVVWGDQNRVLSRERVSGLAERLGAERVEVLDHCGHLAMLERPEQVTAMIRELDRRSAVQPSAVLHSTGDVTA